MAPMQLHLTQYLDAEPDRVSEALEQAIPPGLQAAADRIGARRDDITIAPLVDGVRLDHGLQVLEGSEVRVRGTDRLTVIEIAVPWTPDDRDGTKLLASNAFATTVAARLGGELTAA